uniref:Phosphoglycerate mutase-like protein 1 n=1 Tax=Chenopodium quinoa TaxID=63459 RepID=A0A803MC82_CHEQI
MTTVAITLPPPFFHTTTPSHSSSISLAAILRPRFSLSSLPSIRCISLSSAMDNVSSPSLFPLHHCKVIHLVRHAQGLHNIEGEKNYKAYMKPEYFDAPLTPLGWQQVDNLRRHVRDCGLYNKIELVITSPLLRTLQTTVGVFGGEGYTDGMDVLPMMVANAGNSDRSAISSLNCPPIMAVELCREHLIETDEDTLWKADVRETKAEVAARGMNFMNWLLTRKEKEIAVVTHSGFLMHTLSQFGNDCHPLMKDEISKRFKNCELRSIVLADRNMIGSNSNAPVTNYPGKIPDGPDLPSDLADEKENSHC